VTNTTPTFLSANRRPQGTARAVVVAAVTVVSACYEYAPPPAVEPAPGTELRVTLTDAGSVAAASAVGPRVEQIDGRLARIDADTLVIAATQTTQRGGIENTWNGERVAVPRSAVASLGVRRVSASRTVLAAAAGVAIAVGTIAGFRIGQSGNGNVTTQVPTPK